MISTVVVSEACVARGSLDCCWYDRWTISGQIDSALSLLHWHSDQSSMIYENLGNKTLSQNWNISQSLLTSSGDAHGFKNIVDFVYITTYRTITGSSH